MSTRDTPRVLDCTLRDGGNYTDWWFSHDLVRDLVAATDAAGVHIIELGYRSPPGAAAAGPFRQCSDAMLRDALPAVRAELAFMIDGKDFAVGGQIDAGALAEVVPPARESVFSWCRIATHPEAFDDAAGLSAWVRDRGFKVSVNVMGASTISPAALERVLGRVATLDVDALFFADSLGGLTTEQTVALVDLARAGYSGPLGIHLHDNLGLALPNALAAIDRGVDFVDASLAGMGRGAGNLRTEQLLLALRHTRGRADLDPRPLWPVLERHMRPLERAHGWGWSAAYMVGALAGIHPSYGQALDIAGDHAVQDVIEMLEDLPDAARSRFDERALASVRARHVARRQGPDAERAVVVIPARRRSTRFPDKPLVPILDVPMIVRVARIAAAAVGVDRVHVATDDHEIANVVRAHGFAAVMTSPDSLTGIDRIAEVAGAIDAEIYVNVQGDEPMLDPGTIRAVLDAKLRAGRGVAVNAMARVTADEDVASVNLPKVVASESGRLMYMSRSAVPGSKERCDAPAHYWKQICVYALDLATLAAFAGLGRKSAIECREDIEVLRLLELGVPVQMVEVPGGSIAVDVPEDVARVEAAMRVRGLA